MMRVRPNTRTRSVSNTRSRLVLLTFAALLHAADAAAGVSGCDSLAGIPITPNVDWQTDIKPIINETISAMGRCTSCHNPGQPFGGLDLTDQNTDAIYKIVNYDLIVPGRPELSRLYTKINCSDPGIGARMPASGNPLTRQQQALFYDWIAQGAQGEDPLDPIGRDFVFKDGLESMH